MTPFQFTVLRGQLGQILVRLINDTSELMLPVNNVSVSTHGQACEYILISNESTRRMKSRSITYLTSMLLLHAYLTQASEKIQNSNLSFIYLLIKPTPAPTDPAFIQGTTILNPCIVPQVEMVKSTHAPNVEIDAEEFKKCLKKPLIKVRFCSV